MPKGMYTEKTIKIKNNLDINRKTLNVLFDLANI